MKKIFLLVVLCFIISTVGVFAASDNSLPSSGSSDNSRPVADTPTKSTIVPLENPLGARDMSITDIILKFMQIISYIAVIFGVLMIIWTGLQFVLAQGNAEKIKEKSNQLLWVVVGIGIILSARVLVSLVINTIQATGTVNSTVIKGAQDTINKTSF